MTDTTKKARKKSEPLKRCPSIDVIRVVQFQHFDNGDSAGSGKSQHTMKIEVYCENRLNLFRPYWVRTVALIESKLVRKWADKKLAAGEMPEFIHEQYVMTSEHAKEVALDDDYEWVKMGHIGSKRENLYYIGQYIYVTKKKSGPLEVLMFVDGQCINNTDSFQHNKKWFPGTKARKAMGMYDPGKMWEASQQEAQQRLEVQSRPRSSFITTMPAGEAPVSLETMINEGLSL